MKKILAVLFLGLFLTGSVFASEPMFPKYDKKGNSNVEKVLGVSGFFITAISLFVIFDSENQPKVNRSIVEGTSLVAGLYTFNKFVLKF